MTEIPEFLTAEWRRLLLMNYAVPSSLLQPYLPAGIELDEWKGKSYVSLVGFMFLNTKVKGIPIPFHQDFEEVNLRFYVKRIMPDGSVRRGVTFIKELVPKFAISLVARMVYNEPYETVSMDHSWKTENDELAVEYNWEKEGKQAMSAIAENKRVPMEIGSDAEFITEHYWGYTRLDEKRTSEYPVEHPRWEIYPVKSYEVKVDFGKVYGEKFGFLSDLKPETVMLAEGSEIVVRAGGEIRVV